jgi:hypothetical protein
MNLLWLFDTCGYILGPAIIAAGVLAVVACAWVSFRRSSRRARLRVLPLAMLPLALGLCGSLVGLIVCWTARLPAVDWLALGKVCLAGAAVTVVPLVWAILLIRTGGDSDPRVAVEQ